MNIQYIQYISMNLQKKKPSNRIQIEFLHLLFLQLF